MSIATELTLLANSKQAIKNSINAKGGSITDSTPFADYSTAIDNLPSGGSGNPLLTSIDVSDFSGTTFNRAISYITGATIPNSVTTIGWQAFNGCTSLTSIIIPDSVATIAYQAFNGCTSLTSATIGNGVTTIGDFSFSGCTSLTSITIPNSVTTIATGAFQSCSSLTSATIGNGVTSIGQSAFQDCTALANIGIPSGVTSIGQKAFYNCSALTSVNIPDSVTSIGNKVFYSCTSLTSITIPNSVTTIGEYTFNGCTSLTSVNIPDSVTTIGYGAFMGCSSLASITVNATTPSTLGSKAFDNTGNCPLFVPASSLDTYKAASGWSTYASRIYPITQVATVDGNPVYNYDLRMTSTNTITSENMDKMPAGTSVEFAEGLINIATGEINYQEVILPSTFTGFGDSDMIGSSVTTITSNAVTPPSAFRNRLGGSGLTAIYVPASAVDTYKAHAAWSGFASIIQAIPVPTAMKWTSADETQEISIACEDLVEAGTFSQEDKDNADPDGLMVDFEGSAEIGDCVTTIGENAFNECSSLASITIPDSVTTIGDWAFMDCSSLASVTIGNSVTTIGEEAFHNCSSLASVTIPDSVTTIGENAFLTCTSLASVTIGNSVTTIGNYAFNSCSSLASVTVNATTPPTVADRHLFKGASASLVIYVPSASVDAYKAATNWSTYADIIQAIPTE